MNPIVYNKNGQYRFTDFIGYLPEFLRSEPDVVTYLQVMSDYINNAYRNVDVTEEFELVKVCTSTDRAVVQTWMERLCEMFKLACDRSETVMYLSAPRNNVKSNVTIGSATAEYQKTIEVDLDEIVDTLPAASSRIGGEDALDDGDVVYVKYRKRKLGELVAYYYVKDANILKKDPMAASQDPFTGSYNDPTTAIQFKVDNVGHVVCRYGGNHGELVYYEVYFPVHITNVERVSASGIATYDVNADGKDDSIYVDYYNLTGATKADDGIYNTYIKFGDQKGFGWTGDYPTGLFYFRDSSAAHLTNLTSYGSLDISDTLNDPSVDRYHITKVEKTAGMYRVYLEAFPGIYANAIFYIMRGSENLGVYRMNGNIVAGSRFDEGCLYVDLVNVSSYDYGIEEKDNLTLVAIPLAASKYILDFDNKMSLVTWNNEISDLFEHVAGLNPNVRLTRATVHENELLYIGKAVHVATNTIQIDEDISNKVHVGSNIWSDAFISVDGETPAVGEVIECNRASNGKLRLTVSGARIRLEALQHDVSIYNCDAGILLSVSSMMAIDSEYAYFSMIAGTKYPLDIGDYFVANVVVDQHERDALFRVCSMESYHGGGKLITVQKPIGVDIAVPKPVTIKRVMVDTDTPSSIYKFRSVKMRDSTGIIAGAVKSNNYVGDIFTAKYMLAQLNGSNDYSLLTMVTNVEPWEPSRAYRTGEYVYNPSDKKVYYINRDVTVNELGEISDVNRYTVDNLAHYSVGFKEITNTFMPYCGPVSSLDYDDKIDYQENMKTTRLPLYVKKVNDVRLKYGWEQRQYVHYNDDIGVAARDRAGFVEFYSDSSLVGNDRSPVNVNLRKTPRTHVLPSGTMLSGCGSPLIDIDVDSVPIAQRNESGKWVVTIQSSGHGLSDDARINAALTIADADKKAVFECIDCPIVVISPDVFQYITDEFTGTGYVMSLGNVHDITIQYTRTYIDCDGYPQEGDIAVVGPTILPASEIADIDLRDDVYPYVGENEIAVGGALYLVEQGHWKPVDATDILTPHAIYSRHNMFENSVTNPTFARSDGYIIKSINTDDHALGYVEVLTSKRIPELDVDNADEIYAGKGRVYIEYVNQGAICGWHTIKEVHNGGSFSIYVDPSAAIDGLIAPITNRQMTVYIGRWYKYTLDGYDWDKKSNLVSYVTSNTIMEIIAPDPVNNAPRRYKLKYKHGFKGGDHVLIDATGTDIYNYETLDNIRTAVVTTVIDDYTVELDRSDISSGCLFKGYIIDNHNLPRLNGEYGYKLGNEVVRFRNGDIVITKAQVCLDEQRAWKVSESTAWIPMAVKRTFKIDQISVDMKRNPEFDAGDDFDNESEYKYVTYTDKDVYDDSEAYTVGYACARNYHFEHPHVENLDTTQKVELEYSSKYDYATVAPRDGMDPAFKGVPDMGYPLAERIERLAYLRDPEVIDLDLIGYLARFMGYDITALADDINSSNIYRNSMEREAAIREAVAHLPQFYALSGTKPGINMLMATFGLVGDLITMWTNTDDPYGKLIRQDEVHEQMDIDLANGNTTSAWVPTPHVVLDVLENENFNSVLMADEELNRMKEQIRRCKPIQVVFDGIRLVFNGSVDVQMKLVSSGGTIEDSTCMLAVEQDTELAVDPCMDEDCDF